MNYDEWDDGLRRFVCLYRVDTASFHSILAVGCFLDL